MSCKTYFAGIFFRVRNQTSYRLIWVRDNSSFPAPCPAELLTHSDRTVTELLAELLTHSPRALMCSPKVPRRTLSCFIK